MGKQYPVTTYDEPGSDPSHPENSRITTGNTRVTSGPAQDPRYKGGTFISIEHGDSKRTEIYEASEDDYDAAPRGSSCYIATAVMSRMSVGEDLSILEPLRAWRYSVMERTRPGRFMSNLYRRTAPSTALAISRMPWACSILRFVFVRPATYLVTREPSVFRDVLLYLIFVTGMTTATLLTIGAR